MHRGVFRLCVRVRHTLMLYQGSPFSLITKTPPGHGVRAKLMPEHKKIHISPSNPQKSVLRLCRIAQKVNYLRELIDFMSMTVQYAKAV